MKLQISCRFTKIQKLFKNYDFTQFRGLPSKLGKITQQGMNNQWKISNL